MGVAVANGRGPDQAVGFDLCAVISEVLEVSSEPDPHVIARELVPMVPEDHMRVALEAYLVDRIREMIRLQRMSGVSPSQAKPGVSKWKRLAPALKQRRWTNGTWKFLGEFTADDCAWQKEYYWAEAAKNNAQGDGFEVLELKLRAIGEHARVDQAARVDPSIVEFAL